MLAAGDYDLMQPLFKMYMDALPLRQHAARVYYDHDGAFYPETMYWWGTYNGDNYGWNREGKPHGLTDNRYIRLYWQSGIELLAMMLDHYERTRSASFRDDTLLPYAAATLAFFDQHWPRNEQGTIHFHPAMALETWWDSTNPLPEIASLRWLIPRLVDITASDEQKAAWKRTLEDLPPIPMGEANGERFLLPAEKFATKKNMENPELYAVWPYRLYGVGKPDLEVALATWPRRRHRGTGGWQQNAIQAACLGLTKEAKAFVTSNFSRHAGGYRFPAMWGPNFDWIPDQDHGGVAMNALQNMALQAEPVSPEGLSRGKRGKIYVLPAWPKEWNVHFKLHAPLRTTVECTYRDGEIVELKVEPEERAADVVRP
jgi:hypothetical protein